MKSLFCAGLVLAFALTTISAIAEGGNIHGTVTDPLGAVVPGAQVELLRQGKPVSATTTDAEGKYRFSPLPPGRYQVKTPRLHSRHNKVTPSTLAVTAMRRLILR